MTKDDWGRSWKPWLRGTAIGFLFGAIPAGGAEIPTFLSYVTERKLAKNKDEFGHGAIEGVAGPEATINASAAGGLVPLLTLGIPTTATAAIMLGAFQRYNIQPGPRLFDSHAELVWGLIASLFIGNAMLLVLNLPLAGVWARLLLIPRPYLYAGILFFAAIGAYAANGSSTDLWLLLIIGALGFLMRRFGLPVLPTIVGVILGPMFEYEFRQALQISNGSLSGLVNTPFSILIYVISALIVIVPIVIERRPRPGSARGQPRQYRRRQLIWPSSWAMCPRPKGAPQSISRSRRPAAATPGWWSSTPAAATRWLIAATPVTRTWMS